MNFLISHLTRYDYDREVQILPHLLYLRPRETALLQVRDFRFHLNPSARIDWMRDDFDNLPASVRFSHQASMLEVRSECVVTTADAPPFDFMVRDYAQAFPFEYESLHRFNLSVYLTPPPPDVRRALRRWVEGCLAAPPRETVAWLFALNSAIQANIRYGRRDEAGIQSALDTISLGTGSCRDLAVLLVQCARTLGLAARFVSGYLWDPAVDGKATGDMHAWAEIFLPGAGWRGLDPSRGLFCDNTYVPVAHAIVAESVNPVQGSFFSQIPANARLSIDVRVRQSPGLSATSDR